MPFLLCHGREALDDRPLENTFLVLDHNEDGAVSASEAQAHFEHDEVILPLARH